LKHLLPVLLLLIVTAPRAHAGFDCTRASSPDERTVCSDHRLFQLDDLYGRAFEQAEQASKGDDATRLKIVARGVLADRHACGTRTGCLFAVYIGGLESLLRFGSTTEIPGDIAAIDMAGDHIPPDSAAPPARVGDCTTALITDIGYRLLGPDGKPDGTTVEFANGLHQISYEREPAVVPSRPGDRAIICLTVIPRACPPHDSRGRWYTVTNLRTQTTWSLPDSQHTCGGA
jgi:hypothetical protein